MFWQLALQAMAWCSLLRFLRQLEKFSCSQSSENIVLDESCYVLLMINDDTRHADRLSLNFKIFLSARSNALLVNFLLKLFSLASCQRTSSFRTVCGRPDSVSPNCFHFNKFIL